MLVTEAGVLGTVLAQYPACEDRTRERLCTCRVLGWNPTLRRKRATMGHPAVQILLLLGYCRASLGCPDEGVWAYVACADAGWTDEGCLAPERNQFTKPLVAEKEACPSQHTQGHSDYVTRIIDSEIREGRASK